MTHLFTTSVSDTVVTWQTSPKTHQTDPVTLSLAQHGCEVTSVSEKSTVLQTVLAKVPALLIIYLQASGREGYGLCKILRKLPRTSAVPVVFIGARDPKFEKVEALRCGGNDYLQLPIDSEECWLRLERHLEMARLVRKLEEDKATLHQQVWTYNRMLRQQEQVQVSLAEENEFLQHLAFVDGLTQVANRRKFNQQIPQLWQQSGRNNQPLSLLLCDIDYFKRYNDTYGHPAGDVCLQSVAEALVRGAHRNSDQVARYGGEEFAILLPATDSKGAQQVALAVQSELERAQIPHQASLVKPYVSLSIGICTLVPDSDEQPYEVLVHGADEALYTAKLRGRDRAVVNSADGLISIVQSRCEYSPVSLDSTQCLPTKLIVNPVAEAAPTQTPNQLEVTNPTIKLDNLIEGALPAAVSAPQEPVSEASPMR